MTARLCAAETRCRARTSCSDEPLRHAPRCARQAQDSAVSDEAQLLIRKILVGVMRLRRWSHAATRTGSHVRTAARAGPAHAGWWRDITFSRRAARFSQDRARLADDASRRLGDGSRATPPGARRRPARHRWPARPRGPIYRRVDIQRSSPPRPPARRDCRYNVHPSGDSQLGASSAPPDSAATSAPVVNASSRELRVD